MMYAIEVYDRWDDGTWEFDGYVAVFMDKNRALEYANRCTVSSFHDRFYNIAPMEEVMVRAGGLEDLIRP